MHQPVSVNPELLSVCRHLIPHLTLHGLLSLSQTCQGVQHSLCSRAHSLPAYVDSCACSAGVRQAVDTPGAWEACVRAQCLHAGQLLQRPPVRQAALAHLRAEGNIRRNMPSSIAHFHEHGEMQVWP